MSEDTARIICLGEAVIELSRGADGVFTAACAGDTFNTAVYLARAGLGVGFATAVGDDPYSTASSRSRWRKGSRPISFCVCRGACRHSRSSSMAGPANDADRAKFARGAAHLFLLFLRD